LNSLDDNSPDGFTKNVVLAGMWDTSGTMPNKGKVFYRVLGSGEFSGADYDDARAVLPAGYCASGCDTTQFTFKNIQNPMNSGSFSKRNCIGSWVMADLNQSESSGLFENAKKTKSTPIN